jgi:hypothetical protein
MASTATLTRARPCRHGVAEVTTLTATATMRAAVMTPAGTVMVIFEVRSATAFAK